MSKVITRRTSQASCRRSVWVAYTRLCTFVIPDILLTCLSRKRLTTKARRQAWREKFTLLVTFLAISAVFCFWLEYITDLFCDLSPTYSYKEVYSQDSQMSTINGVVVDWGYLENSTEMSQTVNLYPHQDLSGLFPKFMLLQREKNQKKYDNEIIDTCINSFNRSAQADNWLNFKLTTDAGYLYEENTLISCPIPNHRNETGSPCFYSEEAIQEFERHRKKGTLQFPITTISNFSALPFDDYNITALVVLDNVVLDVTEYLMSATNLVQVAKNAYSRSFAFDRMFLPLDLTTLLFSSMGSDITVDFYSNIKNPQIYKECLIELFLRGVIDNNSEKGCSYVNLALWITLGCFFLYFLIKMNLANLFRLKFMQKILYKSLPSDNAKSTASNAENNSLSSPRVLFFIPCFAESSILIRQTFDSLARSSYPDARKLLFFVYDGVVKNKTDSKETYLCVLEALGYSSSNDPKLQAYISLGQGQRRVNYAKVFAGFYEAGSHRVPFLMVVKVGSVIESLSTTRIPGNRGKRDSMILVLGFLERCMNLAHNRISPLEFEIFNQCYNLLGIDPREIEYMLTTDADIQVQDDAITRLVTRMEGDPKISAVSGHIRSANPEENILTMLQLFPLYLTFFSGLAYEACLGSLTKLNGGFAMYRIWSTLDRRKISPAVGECNSSVGLIPTDFTERPDFINPKQKWAKVSDEIVFDEYENASSTNTNRGKNAREDDDSSSDDNSKSAIYNTAIPRRRRGQLHKKKSKDQPEPLKRTINPNVRLCCAHPTVLRAFAAMQPSTMHTENVLLLGEEKYFSIILLRSLPNLHLAFEPEAIGYITIPTNFLTIQAITTRNLRTSFHVQLELLFAARHLSILYWIVTFIEFLDMIFTMPLTLYLYSVFIRYFIYNYMVFVVIVIAFAWLVFMYILYFFLRLQFKFIIWLCLYCIFSVPFFNVYFPLLAIWSSDFGTCWYDVYPTKSSGHHSRLHGILTDEESAKDRIDEEAKVEDNIIRMRLADFEVLEAEKAARREKEQAEILDAKFTDFTGYINASTVHTIANSHQNKPSWSSAHSSITVPPSAQLKESKPSLGHSRYTSEEDVNSVLLPNSRPPTRPTSTSSSHSPLNPFISELDDPFGDDYCDCPNRPDRTPPSSTRRRHHRKSSSTRLSNFGKRSFANINTNISHVRDNSGASNSPISHNRSHSATSNVSHPQSVHLSPNRSPQNMDTYLMNNNVSVVSLSPSIISSVYNLEEPEDLFNSSESTEKNYEPHRIIRGSPTQLKKTHRSELSEGRNAPIHSRLISKPHNDQ